MIVGASILAISVGLTEESWKLCEVLPLANVIILALITVFLLHECNCIRYFKITKDANMKSLLKGQMMHIYRQISRKEQCENKVII